MAEKNIRNLADEELEDVSGGSFYILPVVSEGNQFSIIGDKGETEKMPQDINLSSFTKLNLLNS